MTLPTSSWRVTSEATAANIAASSTKPTTKNTTKTASAGPRRATSSNRPVIARPPAAMPDSTATCAKASTLLPATLPVSSTRAGTAARSTSTTRVCFSSTTLCAMTEPNVEAETKKTSPMPTATR